MVSVLWIIVNRMSSAYIYFARVKVRIDWQISWFTNQNVGQSVLGRIVFTPWEEGVEAGLDWRPLWFANQNIYQSVHTFIHDIFHKCFSAPVLRDIFHNKLANQYCEFVSKITWKKKKIETTLSIKLVHQLGLNDVLNVSSERGREGFTPKVYYYCNCKSPTPKSQILQESWETIPSTPSISIRNEIHFNECGIVKTYILTGKRFWHASLEID